MPLALSLLLLLLAPAARAQTAVARMVELTQKAVAEGSDERVYASGYNLQSLVNGGSVVYRPALHEVQRAQVDGKAADVDDLVTEGRRQFAAARDVPSPDLRGDLALQESMKHQGRIDVDPSLADSEMGVFRFMTGHAAEGRISLNRHLADIARLVGRAFAAATLFHEGGHAADAAVDGSGVIDGEVPAFQLQYQWLRLVDPTGERLGLLRQTLDAQMRAEPNALTQLAIDYARTLDVLRGTGGDPARIKEFAKQLGYKEGEGKTSASLPQ